MCSQYKVLIVDDQEGIRTLLNDFCHLLGYETLLASSGEHALELADISINMALIDYNTPGLNGLETWKKLRLVCPELKGYMMTGEAHSLSEAASYGLEGVLYKPFELEHIKSILEAALCGD